MKRNWQIRSLGDICEVIGGGTPSKREPSFYGGGIPWATVRDMRSDVIFETEHTITKKAVNSSTTNVIPAGNVVIATRVGLGKVCLVKQDTAINQDLRGIIPIDKSSLDIRFLFWWLKSISNIIIAEGTGATVQGVKLPFVKSLQIPLPPIESQQRIVTILDEAFDGIATTKANTEKNLQNARDIFQNQLKYAFTSRKFPFAPLSSALLVQPRNGWSPPAEFQNGTGNPVLTLSAVTGFQYDGSKVKMSSAPTREGAHYWLSPGELLITRSNTQELVGHVAIYDGTPGKAICCDLIMKMTVDPAKALSRYLWYYLRSPDARAYLTGNAHGASSTMKKIGKQVVQSIPVPLPALREQQKIVESLDALHIGTKRLESICQRKLAALDELKQSLLHQAFSGTL